MKKQLLKKLSTFIVPIAIGMMFSASANAQIVYTDVIPDASFTCSTSPCTQSYNLDLNNDGIVDFTLYAARNTTPCTEPGFIHTKVVYVTSQSGNGTTFTLMMNANDLIGSNLAFSASSGTLRRLSSGPCIHGPQGSGSWTSTSDHYLGLKLTVGTSTYYGWVRLNVVVATSASFTLKDYAYNSIPDSLILAGQTMIITGITENSFASSINLFPNPANNHLIITLGSSNQKFEVNIADITGKIIYSTTTRETQRIEVNTEDFKKGIYIVQIQSAGFIGTKKLVIE